ncbi:unnamed protein product [Cuscuta campestris]|uniref:Uncharacterized protein n=1 Tax=Cuscuta campestris TaxID=132261 RepID=A0A484KA77_9ASTE|nr:unnamed protein product [Cuscuta campestris]
MEKGMDQWYRPEEMLSHEISTSNLWSPPGHDQTERPKRPNQLRLDPHTKRKCQEREMQKHKQIKQIRNPATLHKNQKQNKDHSAKSNRDGMMR